MIRSHYIVGLITLLLFLALIRPKSDTIPLTKKIEAASLQSAEISIDGPIPTPQHPTEPAPTQIAPPPSPTPPPTVAVVEQPVSTKSAETNARTEKLTTETTTAPQIQINVSSANVRTGPGVQYESTGDYVYANATYTIQSTDSSCYWYEVRLENGNSGWIASSVTAPATLSKTTIDSTLSTSHLRPQPPKPAIYIMPLGDEITSGDFSPYNGYRRTLWHLLNDNGIDFDFVGDENSASIPRDFDMHHAGYAGAKVDDLIRNFSVVPHAPDVILLHIGSNDILAGESVVSTVAEIEQLLILLRSAYPDAIVLLARLLPLGDPTANAQIDLLNLELTRLICLNPEIGNTVHLVDLNSNFHTAHDLIGDIHLNQQGAEKVAQCWLDALEKFVLTAR